LEKFHGLEWNSKLFIKHSFGILLFAMITYWVNLSLFSDSSLLAKVGRFSTVSANIILFFILCSRWIVAGYFPLSNLYESLLFWHVIKYLLIHWNKNKSKLIGSILIPVTLLINGFANLTLTRKCRIKSISSSVTI
jgi:ABC-type transport system involved in cytochrome c biogenesis permease subunit